MAASNKRTYAEAFDDMAIEPMPNKKRKLSHNKIRHRANKQKMGRNKNNIPIEKVIFKQKTRLNSFTFWLKQLQRHQCNVFLFPVYVWMIIFDQIDDIQSMYKLKYEHSYEGRFRPSIDYDQFAELPLDLSLKKNVIYHTCFFVEILKNVWSLSIGFKPLVNKILEFPLFISKINENYFQSNTSNNQCKGIVIWSKFTAGFPRSKEVKVQYYDPKLIKKVHLNSRQFYVAFMFSFGEMFIMINGIKLHQTIKIHKSNRQLYQPILLLENVKVQQI